MTKYIKVRPYVAQKIGVEADRFRFADGDYILWDKDLAAVDNGWPFHPEETVARIGGVMLDPYQCKAEQAKTNAEDCIPCPLPTDPAWMPPEEVEEIVEEAVEEAEEEIAGELAGDFIDEILDEAEAGEEGGEE